eukprot:3641144-Prymnesium_polylepis.1
MRRREREQPVKQEVEQRQQPQRQARVHPRRLAAAQPVRRVGRLAAHRRHPLGQPVVEAPRALRVVAAVGARAACAMWQRPSDQGDGGGRGISTQRTVSRRAQR